MIVYIWSQPSYAQAAAKTPPVTPKKQSSAQMNSRRVELQQRRAAAFGEARKKLRDDLRSFRLQPLGNTPEAGASLVGRQLLDRLDLRGQAKIEDVRRDSRRGLYIQFDAASLAKVEQKLKEMERSGHDPFVEGLSLKGLGNYALGPPRECTTRGMKPAVLTGIPLDWEEEDTLDEIIQQNAARWNFPPDQLDPENRSQHIKIDQRLNRRQEDGAWTPSTALNLWLSEELWLRIQKDGEALQFEYRIHEVREYSRGARSNVRGSATKTPLPMTHPTSPNEISPRDQANNSNSSCRTPAQLPPSDATLLKGWQINMHNSQRELDILSKHLDEDRQVGVVAICEPPWFLRRGGAIPRFRTVRALARSEEEKLAIWIIREDLDAARIPLNNERLAAVILRTRAQKKITLVSAYIQPMTGAGWLALRTWLEGQKEDQDTRYNAIWLTGDFNSRHPMWGPATAPITNVAEEIISVMDELDFSLHNQTEAPATFTGVAGESHIDLSLSRNMPSSVSWCVRDDLESLSDHRITETEFLLDNDRINQGAPRKRWRHADWPQIEKALDRLQPHLATPNAILNSASEAAFDSQMNALQIELSKAAAPHVPQGRPSSQRKHWWNEDVARAHSTLKKAKRKGKDTEEHMAAYRTVFWKRLPRRGHTSNPLSEDEREKPGENSWLTTVAQPGTSGQRTKD